MLYIVGQKSKSLLIVRKWFLLDLFVAQAYDTLNYSLNCNYIYSLDFTNYSLKICFWNCMYKIW